MDQKIEHASTSKKMLSNVVKWYKNITHTAWGTFKLFKMNGYGMHIVINFFYHMICYSNVMKTTKKKPTKKTLAYHWDYLPTRRVMWTRQGECGNFTIRQVETGQACLYTVCNTNSFIKKTTHRKQNMLYLADMSSRLTCSNYFLNLTVVSFLSIKLKKIGLQRIYSTVESF